MRGRGWEYECERGCFSPANGLILASDRRPIPAGNAVGKTVSETATSIRIHEVGYLLFCVLVGCQVAIVGPASGSGWQRHNDSQSFN